MANLKVGDAVQLIPGAVYLNNNREVPSKYVNVKLYIHAIDGDVCTISRAKGSLILGDIALDHVVVYNDENVAVIDPYVIKIPTNNFPVYHSPSKNSGVIRRMNRSLITIVDEKNGFGKTKIGAGWIELEKVMVL